MNPEHHPSREPVVTILLPTFNRAALLPRAVESVFAQTCEQWELVIIDDGSRDATPDVIAQYARRDARVRGLRQDNAGPSSARNRGLRAARGRIIACLDSDDEYLPSHLAIRVMALDDHPDIALIHGGAQVIGPPEAAFVPDVHDMRRMIAIADCIVGGTFVARRDAIEEVGGWRDGYGEDLDLYTRIAARHPVLRVADATYLYHRDAADSRCTAAAG